MTFKERDKLVARLRELADFVEARGHLIPGSPYHPTTLSVTMTHTDYVRDPETNEYGPVIDEAKTKQNLKRTLAALGTCSKDYREDRLVLTKKYSDGTEMVRAAADRSIACKRVVVGQKLQPATLIQAKMVDEVEWQCDEGLSLLKLVEGI